jgi:hypothetical protein
VPGGNALTWLLDVGATFKDKASLIQRFGQRESRVQVVESIMGRIRVEDRALVGDLALLWRCKLQERDQSTALTHLKVCLSHSSIEPDLIRSIGSGWTDRSYYQEVGL